MIQKHSFAVNRHSIKNCNQKRYNYDIETEFCSSHKAHDYDSIEMICAS